MGISKLKKVVDPSPVHSSPGQYEEGTSWSKQRSFAVVVGNEMHDLWYWTVSV